MPAAAVFDAGHTARGAATTGLVRLLVATLPAMLLALAPLTAWALSPEEARHLAHRTGDIARPGAVEEFLPLSREQAVDAVLAGLRTTPFVGAPAWAEDAPRDTKDMTAEEKSAYNRMRSEQRDELVDWWYLEMLSTPSPLTERVVLFWHNHFTSSVAKANSAPVMYRQNALFRDLGTRDFAALLPAMLRDPALLIYLDNTRNRAKAPNENLARELMELFTIGLGNYTEEDVKQVARALTGYTVDKSTERFRFDAANHDGGQKTILGRTGAFNADDVASILLDHPKTAETVVAKLWREFVSANPDPVQVAALAERFRADGYAIRPLLRALLLSDAFWNPANRAGLIKSPVEFVVQSVRGLGLPLREGLNLHGAARNMGQTLFEPPNVAGWPGHLAWIDTMTLPHRQSFAQQAVGIWRAEVAPVLFNVKPNRLPNIDAAQQTELNRRFLSADPVYAQPPAPLNVGWAVKMVLLDAGYITK